jgi:hypothetical protein
MSHAKRWVFGLAILALLAGVWAIPASAAPHGEERPRNLNRVRYIYKLMLTRLDHQQDEIDDDPAGYDVFREFDADEQAAGFDTSVLEAALADALASLDEAQAYHDDAVLILEGGAGFDADGYVTDPELARETLREGRKAMKDAGRAIREGRRAIRRGMHEYAKQNRQP